MCQIDLPNFVTAPVLPVSKPRKRVSCVYKNILIGKYLTKVKYLIEQKKKKKTKDYVHLHGDV